MKTITSGNNDHERDAVCSCGRGGGGFVLHGSFDVKLRKRKGKAERESDIFILDGNPLSNIKKKMIPPSLNRLYLEDAPHVRLRFYSLLRRR